jgi:hypothetical protein
MRQLPSRNEAQNPVLIHPQHAPGQADDALQLVEARAHLGARGKGLRREHTKDNAHIGRGPNAGKDLV